MSGQTNAGPKTGGASAPTRLRQIALVTRDLEKARHQIVCTIGNGLVVTDIYIDARIRHGGHIRGSLGGPMGPQKFSWCDTLPHDRSLN